MTIKRWAAGLMALVMMMALAVNVSAETTLAAARTTLKGAGRAKKTNITLAIEAIDGTVVEAGGYFSFNDAVGPRTSSYGYVNALNGRGVKVSGGGVGQVASTLYLALKELGGISYDEKETYSNFTDKYVTNKSDAILVDHKAGIDFSFYNNSGQSFRVDMWMTSDTVRCALVATGETSGIQQLGGGGATSIYLDGTAAQVNNITLAADSVYDTTLESGDEFSFNDIVGPRTERYGYKTAVNGRGVKTVGGGVAQVASAIYMAVKRLDSVEITEKSTYKNYNQHYVANESDAISVDYQGDIDFCFRYNGYGALTIYTYVSGDTLYCEVMET